VGPADFSGGTPAAIGRTLGALPVAETVAFFAGLGVSVHEEALGKLFPDSQRARTVLDALLDEARHRGVSIRPGSRVSAIRCSGAGFAVGLPDGDLHTRTVVVATGGQSLPKSGSDGLGYELVRALGHTIVATTPALVPLVLAGEAHRALSGVSAPVELVLAGGDGAPPPIPTTPSHDAERKSRHGPGATAPRAGRVQRRIRGSLLWTHVGVSGPAVLDMSRHWLRARLEGRPVSLTASLLPGTAFEAADAALLALSAAQPKLSLRTAVGRLKRDAGLPAAVAAAVAAWAGADPDSTLAALPKAGRRAVVHALTSLPLPVTDSRGYNHAEVTAGGVALHEVDPATMASRVCPGLFLAGEILDVDGRLGGFNFQWAWASARAAARGVALALDGR
jgi:hypothetical protein